MSRRITWQQLYERFDPELESIPNAWRADRKRSPAADITRALDRPATVRTQQHILLSGTMGTGKTTELLRVAEARAWGGAEFVVFVDLLRHFNQVVGDAEALQHVSAWEVSFLVGLALVRAAEDQLGYKFDERALKELGEAWSKAAKASQPQASEPSVDVAALAKSMILLASDAAIGAPVSAGLKILGAVMGAAKWALPIGRRDAEPLADQDAPVQTLLAAVNQLIVQLQQWYHRRVLFVVDGLDRIRDFDRARALFIKSEMIGRLACPLIVAAPFALRYHMATSTIRSFNRVCTLVNEPVLLHDDPSKHGPGIRFFCDVYDKRVGDLPAEGLVPRPILERLAYYSGGSVRDFIKLIGMLAERAWDEDADSATDTLAEQVIEEARLLVETGLDRGHIGILEEVARDQEHRLPDDERARDLLNFGRLLSFPNESEWYYPHPLLAIHLLKLVGRDG